MATFPISFRGNTLRKHRRKILFEREKALLPTIQIFVEQRRIIHSSEKELDRLGDILGKEYDNSDENREKIAYRYMTSHIKYTRLSREILKAIDLVKSLKALMKNPAHSQEGLAIALANARKERTNLKLEREQMSELYTQLSNEYSNLRGQYNTISATIRRAWRLYNGEETTARREFIMGCPVEDCRGFLSSAYKCGTCDSWACQACLVVLGAEKDESHVCNPDTVESAKMIRAETQPCPKCGTRIFKIDGCDQMFCVMEGCGTAFSWNTGHIVTGIIHNPHYYEWLRRNGAAPEREAGDIPCGGMPTPRQLMHAIQILREDASFAVLESFRNISEMIAMRLPTYPARVPQLMNKELDVDYLMNVIDENTWRSKLELAEARFNRKKEIGQILQTLATSASDIMRQIYVTLRDIEIHANTMDEEVAVVDRILLEYIPNLNQLREFGNESLQNLGKRDRIAVPQFGELWAWKPSRILYKPKKGVTEAVAEDVTEVVAEAEAVTEVMSNA
jgi:hypothetical protein